MRKEIAIIVDEDVTDLNRRLREGYQTYNMHMLPNGKLMFILVKYTHETSSGRDVGLDAPAATTSMSLQRNY